MKIIIADNGVYVERARRCFIMTKGREKFLVEGDESLALHLGTSSSRIQEILKEKKFRNMKVRLANLGEVTAHFGSGHPVKDMTSDRYYQAHKAKPCKVVWRAGGARRFNYLRSMSATRRAWGLDQSTFEKIVAKVPGWRKLLPMYLEEIQVVDKIPKNAEDGTIIEYDTSGIKVEMASVGREGVKVTFKPCSKKYKSPMHVPPQVRELAEMGVVA